MKKSWEKAEEKILLDNIKRFESRKEAFAATSENLDRSTGACESHWKKIKNNLPAQTFETVANVAQVKLDETTNDKPSFEYDLLTEVGKIIDDNKLKTAQVAELTALSSEKEGIIFDLEFQLSQAQNEKENLEYQVEKFAGLVEASMSEQAKYIEENRTYENQKEIHESKLKQLQEKLDGSEAMIAHYKKENERLKNEKEEYMNENNTIMNLFNKARKMFTGTDKDETTKFKMERNGNLERIV